jgi:succinoglycan biosynthesis protein ExoM
LNPETRPHVSICIATYRRPHGLARLLDSLERLKLPPELVVETIVVDNDADGSAASIAQSRSESLHPLRYCVEPRQNIAHARNRAVSEASGEWLVFIDDDEAAAESWIVEYLALVDREACDGAFGPVLAELEEAVTPWLDVQTFFSRRRYATGAPVGLADLRTSNALLHRRLFEGRDFDSLFGRTGGSDSELFGRMLSSGARFLWCDEAQVVEFIPPERHRLGWLTQRAFRGGCVSTRLERRVRSTSRAYCAVRAIAFSGVLLLLAPLAVLGGRRRLAQVWLRMSTQAGHLWSLLGRSYEEYGPRRCS